MNTTPVSLLDRLRGGGSREAWDRFVQLYTPLLFYWARRTGLHADEAEDLVQEMFAFLLEKLPAFAYDPGKSFRNWLRTVLVNKWRERQRRRRPAQGAHLEEIANPGEPEPLGEAEYREHLTGRALEIMRAEFEPATWRAFWEYVARGRSAAEVAEELGISANAVYIAKSRVLSRLRQELAGLLD